MLPEVSVIVPAYNASAYIADCIQSVKTQTCTSWELIIINDGSTDKTVEIINNFLSDSRIKLVNQQNKGVSAARNKGIEVSLGKYIAFLDADDCFLGNNLQLKCEALDKNPAIDFAYSDVWRCDEKLNNLYIEKGVDFNNLFFEVMLRSTLTIPGLSSNLMLRASSIKSLGLLFDENLSNCADWYMKILLATRAKGIYISEALAKYRNTPG
ncbi:MAG TPA: glycosyltransferase, partial [Bacteroidia bacterium]|nr:glycosyltransferase [Bacteroidia bacterium]